MRSITIGQYYPADSVIHRLDPRIKLFGSLIYITMLFMLENVYGYAFAAVCLVSVIISSKIPVKYMLRGLRMIIYIILFTAVMNIFFSSGETVIFSVWKINIAREGLLTAGEMSFRLILLMVGASILTLSTTPIKLTDAIEFALKPFSKIGVPSHEIAMMMTIALRFIPTLLEELDKIMKAQMARGADFDTGGLIKKAKSLIPLLVPLFVSSFRRADELATAMEARCYKGGEGRTKMNKMRFCGRDYAALAFLSGFIGAIIALNIL